MRCAMCQTDLSAPAAPAAGADPYRRCSHCGGVFLDPYPAVQSNVVFEGPEGVARQAEIEAGRRAYFARHLVRIERRMDATVQNWRLLEIGCGSGVLLSLARERGWRADAIELSPELVACARAANPDAEITCGDITDPTVGRADYDAVLALDVIEHVLAPDDLLRNCGAHLRRGGLLLLQTPNAEGLRHRLEGPRWDMRDPRQHVNLYTARGLVGALGRTGYEVVSLGTISGTGLEAGWRRVAARVKEGVLDQLRLGNALVVVGRRK
ncbi:class I SAM-dependent methyltransferase [bacterium]|nr:class I SAM-dependent methyltransferase [bacterium]